MRSRVVHFLRSDHRSVEEIGKRLRLSLRKLSKKKQAVLEAGKIQEGGIFLVSLLRHHIELEKESIHKTIKTELDPHEKKEIARKVNGWLKTYEKWKT